MFAVEWLEFFKAVIIGIVQGITEWLPISSTGHMILVDEFLKLHVSKEFMDMFLVVIQFGSILAVLVLFFHKLNPFSPRKSTQEKRQTLGLWGKVIVGSIPAAVLGLLFNDLLTEYLYNYQTVALMLILYGILFIVLENRNRKRRPRVNTLDQLDYKTAFAMGAFQVLAMIPGTSRSGSTILGAMFIGTSRYVAAEFSFFLAIPVMFGASGLRIVKYGLDTGFAISPTEWMVLLTGLVVAFVVSLAAIRFLMGFIKKHDFKPFGYYRIVLGILVLLYFALVH